MMFFVESRFIEELESLTEIIENNILFNIIVNYPQLNLFTDYEYEIDSYNNPNSKTFLKFSLKNTIPPNFEDDISSNWNKYDLIFTFNKKDWFTDANENGILCFHFLDYENKINALINKYHYKVDLSESSFGWESLIFIDNSKNIQISDNYILADTTNQKIEANLIPLLKRICPDDSKNKLIKIFTLTQSNKENKYFAINQLKKKYNILKKEFSNCEFEIMHIGNYVNFDFHDRIIMNNIQIVECGKGFNLIPHKSSNSIINSNTIFDIFTYKRMKNLKRKYQECSDKLNIKNQFFITKYPEHDD